MTLSQQLPDAARFQLVADAVNDAVRHAIAETLGGLLDDQNPPGPDVVAAIAGTVTAAGYLCGNFEPSLDGSVFATSGTLVEQFNEGRKAAAQ
jgi:hypothetical protein